MILQQSDLDELEHYLDKFKSAENVPWFRWENNETSVEFFAERPHLILPAGFDQTRPLIEPDYADLLIEEGEDVGWVLRCREETETVKQKYGIDNLYFDFPIEYLYRHIGSGAWRWFLGLENDNLVFRGPGQKETETISIENLFKNLKRLTNTPDQTPRTLWLPKFWTPEFQNQTRIELTSGVSSIIQAINSENKDLLEVSPRTLEEIVAELLRAKGLEIYLTPQSRDGGRDIVARGELFPGEPITLAVEVKHKAKVGTPDLDRSLKANEDFPALMLATSGKFSAGVIKEQQRNRNKLRLILKDGMALSQWIKAYGLPKPGIY